MESSSESFPSDSSFSTAAAVNCFDADAISNNVAGVFATPRSRSASP